MTLLGITAVAHISAICAPESPLLDMEDNGPALAVSLIKTVMGYI
jgi:hypothetical protein